MPIFKEADLDSELSAEVQDVVDAASTKMTAWLNESFERIDQSMMKELDQVERELEQYKLSIQQEDDIRTREIITILESLSKATEQLTPLDAEQLKVIGNVSKATLEVKKELTARTARWEGLGSKAIKLAHKTVKTAMGGII